MRGSQLEILIYDHLHTLQLASLNQKFISKLKYIFLSTQIINFNISIAYFLRCTFAYHKSALSIPKAVMPPLHSRARMQRWDQLVFLRDDLVRPMYWLIIEVLKQS